MVSPCKGGISCCGEVCDFSGHSIDFLVCCVCVSLVIKCSTPGPRKRFALLHVFRLTSHKLADHVLLLLCVWMCSAREEDPFLQQQRIGWIDRFLRPALSWSSYAPSSRGVPFLPSSCVCRSGRWIRDALALLPTAAWHRFINKSARKRENMQLFRTLVII